MKNDYLNICKNRNYFNKLINGEIDEIKKNNT